jgi:hypothetical protein
LELAEETVMLDPVAVSDPVWLWLLPTKTVPKLMLAGLRPSWLEPRPIPVNDVGGGEAPPLITTEMEPPADPATVGANMTVRTALSPAASERGILALEVKLKAAPVTLA